MKLLIIPKIPMINECDGLCGGQLCVSTHCVLFCCAGCECQMWKTLCFYTLCVVLSFRVRAPRVKEFAFIHIVQCVVLLCMCVRVGV